ncbi:ABC transporter ATP-binding protein [Mesorhizobium sp. CO1-1-8]|uniref:ABC transporter ATP-binding protein n=1 Tax=Mesorhizobium sp. CO1-1-8 TaxID=2876631 RepID=UPI001CD0E7F0|nr:ABC transporter ATP-binding protein [Mesorhizobium sp. CO1-1-8]MBZ9772468.1 ABC transporter ATP-binding protein [Mesorhizobium sp. CO1-1-8]
MSLLRVEGAVKKYGTFTALNGVSLAVRPQTFHGLIGPNGSGKSTLLKAITGAHQLNGGTIHFAGNDVTRHSSYRRARSGMSLKFQITSVLPELSLFENLLLAKQASTPIWSQMRSGSAAGLREEILLDLQRFGLRQRSSDLAGVLSHGQQQWLEIAMAVSQNPKLLLLDEPTGGMSLEERRATGEFLVPLKSATSVVIVEHDLDFIKTICDTVTVLDQGKVIFDGRVDELDASEAVRRVYTTRA